MNYESAQHMTREKQQHLRREARHHRLARSARTVEDEQDTASLAGKFVAGIIILTTVVTAVVWML